MRLGKPSKVRRGRWLACRKATRHSLTAPTPTRQASRCTRVGQRARSRPPAIALPNCGFYLLKGNPVFFGVISTSSASNGRPRMRLRGEHTLEFELKSDGHSIKRWRSITSAAFAAPPQERSPIIDHLKIFEDELGTSNRTLIPGLSPSTRCVGTARSLKILRPISEWFLVAPFAKFYNRESDFISNSTSFSPRAGTFPLSDSCIRKLASKSSRRSAVSQTSDKSTMLISTAPGLASSPRSM